jgi:hypothetical protein
MRLAIIFILITVVCAQQYKTMEYIPPQSIGAGMFSSGGYREYIHTYHSPQSIGAGMVSSGGWAKEPMIPKDPLVQSIIDFTTFMARGKSRS